MECLFSQLKAEVNNSNLPYFDTLFFTVNGRANYSMKLGKSSMGTCKFTAGDLYVDSPVPTADKAAGAPQFNITTSGVSCKVTNISELRMFNINEELADFNISSLLDCPKIVFICFAQERAASCKGDVKKFLTDFAALNPDRAETLKITASYGGFTNIPTGVGGTWDTMGEVFFDSSYTDGWYIKASNGTYYDSDGNVITPQ